MESDRLLAKKCLEKGNKEYEDRTQFPNISNQLCHFQPSPSSAAEEEIPREIANECGQSVGSIGKDDVRS